MAKLASKKKAPSKEEVVAIEPKVVGNVEPELEDTLEHVDPSTQLFSVKLDSKKIENRTAEQVLSLVSGSLGGVKKISIDLV